MSLLYTASRRGTLITIGPDRLGSLLQEAVCLIRWYDVCLVAMSS